MGKVKVGILEEMTFIVYATSDLGADFCTLVHRSWNPWSQMIRREQVYEDSVGQKNSN